MDPLAFGYNFPTTGQIWDLHPLKNVRRLAHKKKQNGIAF
jgi:hypothetical protein